MQESIASPMSRGSEAKYLAAVDEVRKNYVVPPDSSVVDFLSRHRAIPELLLQAMTHLRRFFGADAVFGLRAPLDEFGSQTLYGVVLWPGRAHEARTALERFDEAWWIANSRQAAGNLTFTYELV